MLLDARTRVASPRRAPPTPHAPRAEIAEAARVDEARAAAEQKAADEEQQADEQMAADAEELQASRSVGDVNEERAKVEAILVLQALRQDDLT